MSEESALWQVALLDRGEALVVMGRKKYEALYEEAQELTKERDDAWALLAALKAEHQPADELRSELLAEIEAHAETKAEVERLRSALRLLWEEATTEDRCATEYAPGCYGHHISKPCRQAVGAALKEGDR